jgi:hypothetical protein
VDSPSIISSFRVELEVQRCLIERQQIEIQRLQRRMEVLLRTLDAAASAPQGNDGNEDGHRSTRHFRSVAISSSVRQSGIVSNRSAP